MTARFGSKNLWHLKRRLIPYQLLKRLLRLCHNTALRGRGIIVVISPPYSSCEQKNGINFQIWPFTEFDMHQAIL